MTAGNDPIFDFAFRAHQAGNLREAEQVYRDILARDPNHADAIHFLGVIAHQAGQNDQAISLMQRSIAIKPTNANYYNNLGLAFQESDRLDEALASYQRALAIDANMADTFNNIGQTLKMQGRIVDAVDHYRRALAINPSLSDVHSNLILAMLYDDRFDARAQAEEQNRWARMHAAPLQRLIPKHDNDRNPARRLRIGLVSPDFYGRAGALFLAPLFEQIDREAFEIFCYSNVAASDSTTARLRVNAAAWRDVTALDDAQLAERIHLDRVDILLDLSGHTNRNRLLTFARKPAPIQATWFGLQTNTGLPTIDYRLTDPYLDPPELDSGATFERPFRLPESFWCYQPLSDLPAVGPLPAISNGHVTFGCLNTFSKVTPSTLQLWSQVLRAVSSSCLAILAPRGSARKNVLENFVRAGVAEHRIEFFDRGTYDQYLRLNNRIDISLDTIPYNGHTTGLDSIWMGVPVVTMIGDTPVGRAGWGQISCIGLGEMAACTNDEFVRISVKLATDVPRLAALRQSLRKRMEESPLMGAARFTRNFESALRDMWRRYCTRSG